MADWAPACNVRDLLATPRFNEAAEFFLDELYGAKDVDQRDTEAQKVAPKLAAMLPARAIDALLLAVQLEEMAEQFDIEMSRTIDLPITAKELRRGVSRDRHRGRASEPDRSSPRESVRRWKNSRKCRCCPRCCT